MKNKFRTQAAMGAVLAFAALGCAKKQTVKPEPKAEATAEVMAEATPTPEPASRRLNYTVKRGDNLWSIASKRSVLDDPFRWPLLYKYNRDEIQDPDLIEPAQDLQYPEQVDPQEAAEAVRKAQDTPPYQPHDKPRKNLPLKY